MSRMGIAGGVAVLAKLIRAAGQLVGTGGWLESMLRVGVRWVLLLVLLMLLIQLLLLRLLMLLLLLILMLLAAFSVVMRVVVLAADAAVVAGVVRSRLHGIQECRLRFVFMEELHECWLPWAFQLRQAGQKRKRDKKDKCQLSEVQPSFSFGLVVILSLSPSVCCLSGLVNCEQWS